MFITIRDKKTGEEVILRIKSYDLDNFVELFEIVDNLKDFDFHFEPVTED